MKTKFFSMAICLILAVVAFGQNKQQTKAEIKSAKVDSIIQSGYYKIIVNQVSPMGGQVRHLTTDYLVVKDN